LSL
ncbi:hypothetical protein CP061683_0522B, partial [Chlamydia psittaci 06-1683]|jgi:hypothetical protein